MHLEKITNFINKEVANSFMKSATIKRISAIVLVVLLVAAFSATAYAANLINYGTNWTTVASNPSGLNRNIAITCYNTTTHGNDIRMLNSSGQEVWYESNAIGYSGYRLLWCGSDVCTVQIRNLGAVTSASNYCIVEYK